MNKPLFDESDDNSEKSFDLKTNKDYAKSYNHLRKKELLQKFNNKGFDASDSESTSDSDSSEEDEVLDPAFDQVFLKTLSSLKSKDPTIYDKNIRFFQSANASGNDIIGDGTEAVEGKAMKKDRKPKPVTLKDYERKIILEKGGKFEDDSDEEYVPAKNPFRPASPSLAEDEKRLRAEFKNVIDQNESSDEEFGGIFKKREKSMAEQEKEEEDYLKWLAGKNETIDKEAQEKLTPLKTYWSNDKLPSSEKFLRDYILNKGYTEANNYSEIPTYEEIIGDNAPLSEDEAELEKQAEFEHKYNFRFEDPDQEFIKRYPRTVDSSVRTNDDKRKQKRQEIKERKIREKDEKMKELEMVRELKRKEIEEKIQKLKMVTGNDELGFNDDDLEEDFDPEAHDRRMQELFDDDFYQLDEGEEKPECPSDIDELKVEDWDNYDPQQEWNNENDDDLQPHCEDEDFIMDCDYDPSKAKEAMQKELIENTRKRKGRKGRLDRFKEIIKAKKPVFDPEDEKTYGEYIDEYYKLDCEDIIGDTPCRFKYVETTPNDFGLTVEEILLAKNKELNQWASLKKAVQIRPDHVEKKEQRLYKLKSKNEDLKRKIFKSLYGEESDNDNEDEESPKKMESKQNASGFEETNTNKELVTSKNAKKSRKRKAPGAEISNESKPEIGVLLPNSDNSSIELELETKKHKLEDDRQTKLETVALQQTQPDGTESKKKKKNRKKKKNNNNVDRNNDNKSTDGARKLANQAVKSTENKQKFTLNNNDQAVKSTENKQKIILNDNNDHINPNTKKLKKKFNTFKDAKKGETNNSAKPKQRGNPFTDSHSSPANTKNKFRDSSILSVQKRPLPPLRQNMPKGKISSGKPKPKFGKNKNTKSAGGTCSSSAISDERLKAYGINPRKFHKKQKYGSGAEKQQKE